MRPVRPFALSLILCLASCGRGAATAADSAGTPSAGATPPARIPDAALDSAARDVVGFLQGRIPAERISLSDTVLLVVSAEGGGGRAAIPGGQRLDPARWVVGAGRGRIAFAPPAGLTRLDTRVGRHVNCTEQPLAPRFPSLGALAALPHVGVRLRPDGDASCLQGWNATLLFDSLARPPRLVAVAYDQWEW